MGEMCGCGLPITDPRAMDKSKPAIQPEPGRPIHADELPVNYVDLKQYFTDMGRKDLVEE